MFPERWRAHRPNYDISCANSKVSVMSCSFSADLPKEVETWELRQICLVDLDRRNISTWLTSYCHIFVSKKQVCCTLTFHHVKDMMLRQRCVSGNSGWKSIICMTMGTVPSSVTTAQDDSHLVSMDTTDRTASSTVLSQHWNRRRTLWGYSSLKSFESWLQESK